MLCGFLALEEARKSEKNGQILGQKKWRQLYKTCKHLLHNVRVNKICVMFISFIFVPTFLMLGFLHRACMATMVILYYRIAQRNLLEAVPEDGQE